MKKMTNWSNLDVDLLIVISEKLQFCEDFKAFGGVCTWWRKSIKLAHEPTASRHTPWLMLPEPPSSEKRLFRGLNDQITLEMDVPDIAINCSGDIVGPEQQGKDCRCLFSSRGWLICITQIGYNIRLVHPLSKVVIDPPPLHILVTQLEHDGGKTIMDSSFFFSIFSDLTMQFRFALSDNPSTNSSYALAAVTPNFTYVTFWRSGDENWTIIYCKTTHKIRDITFYKGELYAVRTTGEVVTFGKLGEPHLTTYRVVANLKIRHRPLGKLYLVELDNVLLVIKRHVRLDDTSGKYNTHSFSVWEVNVESREFKRTKNLGHNAIFVGDNSSFSMTASPSQGCKPNCIYYTDKTRVGVFDLGGGHKYEDLYVGSSKSLGSCRSHLWVESSLANYNY